ncbi:hypothetical protein, partial [Crenothrix polyspora]|uniref:hypothetical protein n=1 Tax=Crenothrix polyspora TaxID=360316 RepID=UPI001594933F
IGVICQSQQLHEIPRTFNHTPTTTAPENERGEARSRHRKAPAAKAEPTRERHHGAHRETPPKPRPGATIEREGTKEKAPMKHPQKQRPDHPTDGYILPKYI